jgi:glycosyltransferase involved in cell wall biosynthesis
VEKIILINLTGGPIIKEDGFSFTEGGLVHALFALANLTSDYDITILCPDLPGNNYRQATKYKGVNILCLGNSKWIRWMHSGNLSFLRATKRYVGEKEPDILIGNGVSASCFLRFVPTRACKIGVIHHLYHTASVNGSSKYAVLGTGVLERLALNLTKLDRIAVISPMVKDTLLKEGFGSEDKIVVVGNGVNVEDYFFSESKVPYSLIYIGRLTELKRVSSLVEVVSMVKKKIPGVVLHIVGDGPKHEKVIQRIEDLDLLQNIIVHGYLSEEEKIELLSSSALYLSNSAFEGFGIPLVEAMATGAVPIVSNIDAHRFIFQGEDVGCLVADTEEMARRIVDLLTDEAERLKLAKNGRRLVGKKWTWARVGEKYRELIER